MIDYFVNAGKKAVGYLTLASMALGGCATTTEYQKRELSDSQFNTRSTVRYKYKDCKVSQTASKPITVLALVYSGKAELGIKEAANEGENDIITIKGEVDLESPKFWENYMKACRVSDALGDGNGKATTSEAKRLLENVVEEEVYDLK